MSLIKGRNWTKKEDEELLIVINELQEKKTKVTWNYIAQLIKQRNPQSRKNGKQCRERWANQLDPEIKRNENWTKEQDETLFRLHLQLGNKWSEICSHLKGRTDNCIKNHFYSTLRRGFRKLNSYIENIKRKATLSKVIKNQILNKILALCQGKKDSKFLFNEKAKTLAHEIKSKLIILSLELSQLDEENISFKDQIYSQMLEFSRNCKKRKTKRTSQFSDQSDQEFSKISQIQINAKTNQKSNSCKKNKNSKVDQQQSQQNKQIIQDTKKKENRFKRKISVLEKSYQSHFLDAQREDFLKLIHKREYHKQIEGIGTLNMRIQEKQKRNQEKKPNETGFFEFIRPKDGEQIQQRQKNQQKISGNFSKLVTSQEFQDYHEFKQSFGLPISFLTSDNIASVYDENPHISFSSPLYSPFSFCRPPNWVAHKEQMFKSTRFQQSSISQKEQQVSRKKQSAFKLIKRECVVDIIKSPTE